MISMKYSLVSMKYLTNNLQLNISWNQLNYLWMGKVKSTLTRISKVEQFS